MTELSPAFQSILLSGRELPMGLPLHSNLGSGRRVTASCPPHHHHHQATSSSWANHGQQGLQAPELFPLFCHVEAYGTQVDIQRFAKPSCSKGKGFRPAILKGGQTSKLQNILPLIIKSQRLFWSVLWRFQTIAAPFLWRTGPQASVRGPATSVLITGMATYCIDVRGDE